MLQKIKSIKEFFTLIRIFQAEKNSYFTFVVLLETEKILSTSIITENEVHLW